MTRNAILVIVLAAIAAFAAGFLVANKLNASEIAALRAQISQNAPANTDQAKRTDDSPLTADEIRAKIDEADKNPDNFSFQKNLGIALYRYAAMKQDESLLVNAIRILTRANSLDPKDYYVIVALGNGQFDTGFAKKDNASFQKARDLYSQALAMRPDDPDVRTDRALTYFLQDPPDYDKAAAELQKVLAGNPSHDRSLQFLVQVYVKQNRIADADKMLARLKEVNPSDPSIADLTSQIAVAKGGATK